jgi:LPS sulfotransferase NodH/SAM-dependent methyltransferase
MQVEASVPRMPVRWTDETFDFKQSTPLRKCYIIASLPRSGSQFLASELWKTGLLGAPCEYLFPAYDMRPMMNRLKSVSPADYIAKLLACRTSRNGVFGMNVHIQHFNAFLRAYPVLPEVLAPLTFIHTTRRNKVAQAVSMAKAYQTSAWTSQMKSNLSSKYDRKLIETCLEDVAQQERDWEVWFASNNVTPFRVVYEDLAADRAGMVRSIIELLGVQDDEPEKIELPPVEKQSDSTNKEWIARFEAETACGSARSLVEAIGTAGENVVPGPGAFVDDTGTTPSSSFAGLYDHYISNLPAGNSHSAAYVDAIRSRQLFKVIVEQNRGLFENAQVLEFPSVDGRWGLAALDAGAAHVVSVEAMPRLAARAARTFAEYGVSPEQYEFINADIFSAVGSFEPESFDLIMCVRFFERFDPHQSFRELHRLRPRFVILDTAVAPGRGPVLRYALRMPEITGARAMRQNNGGSIVATPSDDLIAFMCDFFGFRCHSIDWQAMGITNWTGIHDYERGRRRTYVLERAW